MSTGSFETIEVEQSDSIGQIRLNRPDSLNSMSVELQAEVVTALDAFADDDGVRVVVVSGNGRAFSAGYNLNDVNDLFDAGVVGLKRELERTTRPFVERIWNFPKPTIAAVHGYCLAGACEIAMLMDITIATESCMLGEPEIRFSSASPTLIMPWLVPMKIAKELLLSGSMITAQRAYEIGMVNRVVPDDDLMDAAMAQARVISKISPLAARLTKEGIQQTYNMMGLQNALQYHYQMAHMLDGTGTEEMREFGRIAAEQGVRAALDWRDAQFRDAERA